MTDRRRRVAATVVVVVAAVGSGAWALLPGSAPAATSKSYSMPSGDP